MSAAPLRDWDLDSEARVRRAQLQLVDAVSDLDLRRVPTTEGIAARLAAVAAQLHAIEQDLRLVIHLTQLEQDGIEERLADIETQIAGGWVPPSRPIADVVADLRERYGA